MANTDCMTAGLRMLALRDIRNIFDFRNDDAARNFLALLNIPTLTYSRHVKEAGHEVVFPEERALAMSVELAFYAAMLPGGEGVHLDSTFKNPIDSLPDGLTRLNKSFRIQEYWKLFQRNPHHLQLMVALSALMYGSQDERELHKRLWALGDYLYRETSRNARRTRKGGGHFTDHRTGTTGPQPPVSAH